LADLLGVRHRADEIAEAFGVVQLQEDGELAGLLLLGKADRGGGRGQGERGERERDERRRETA
jgi:hypothetical protein